MIDAPIDVRFWHSVSAEEFHKICEDDGLTGELLERFCRMMDIQPPWPKKIEILLSADDVDRVLARRKVLKRAKRHKLQQRRKRGTIHD